MKTCFAAIAIFSLCFTITALGQQAKLEGHVYETLNDKDSSVSAVRIITPGGQAAVTDAQGHFIIAFPSTVSPGQATRIELDPQTRPEWVIYEPLLGNCVTQSSARNFEPLKVIIVRRGSPLALAPKRLNQVIALWANERVKMRSQVAELKAQLNEYAFLQEYSEKYGFTLNQFLKVTQQWAEVKDSDDKEERALKEYWRKNYGRAAQLALESTPSADAELEQAIKQKNEAGHKVIRRFKLAGNAFYEDANFREALGAYDEIEKRFLSKSLVKEDWLEEWADLKLLLGNTKEDLGERVEGRESQSLLSESVQEYRQAFAIFTREQLPQQWAITQNNLGIVLGVQGERATGAEGVKLLGEAVQAFRAALQVSTREQQPQPWATTQNNLGNVLRAQGVRVEGAEGVKLLEQAVEAYRAALQVFTREQLSQHWAITHHNLGVVLEAQGVRVAGTEGVKLLEQAAEAYRAALQITTREQSPEQWAATQNNLGIVLASQGERVAGAEGVKLLEQAVEAYRVALQIRTRERLPQHWAMTQGNLGNLLQKQAERVTGAEGVKLLEQAVEAYRLALQVFTREQLPQRWAATQSNLGAALRILGERVAGAEGVKLLEQAAEAYRVALQIRTREQLPQQWAITQNNLGVVLRVQGERAGGEEGVKLLEQAVAAFRSALQVRAREQQPQQWAITQNNLAKAYFQLRDWPAAAEAYTNTLSLLADEEEAYSRASELYHNVLFKFEEAFALNQQWITRHPIDVTAQAVFAEKQFTTARYEECERRINALLVKQEVSANTKLALRAIEIADLLALGQAKEISAKIEALLTEISQQPVTFKVDWSFNGTRYFIGQNEKLANYREWLGSLFDALAEKNRETILSSLRKVGESFRQK